jgi:hypothetical protein
MNRYVNASAQGKGTIKEGIKIMKRKQNSFIGSIGRTLMALTLAGALCLAGAGTAFADDQAEPYWTPPDSAASVDNFLTTYGVRAGSAGPDFLGISNTNFDFTAGSATSTAQYPVPSATTLDTVVGAGLAIWATDVNEEENPYYQNLYYNAVAGSLTATQATTWMSNPVASWGDSNASPSTIGNVAGGTATIAGLEFSPDIIFGANKVTNWQNASSDGTDSPTALSAYFSSNPWLNYGPTWTSNDATNIWGQVYTLGKLAQVADDLTDGTSKVTRYNGNVAVTSAVNYEKAIQGNLLYIASQIDGAVVAQKTVAYLYSIDSSDTGYFFTPTALPMTAGLLTGDDTGKAPTSATTPDTSYAANNATIDMGYMATLPFITTTYDSGTAFVDPTTSIPGIIMGVEDIFKASPACTVASGSPSALADVDVIIYNTTTLRGTDLIGVQSGRNSSGIDINTSYDASYVASWATDQGFKGTLLIAGDDFFTSPNQGYGTVPTTTDGMAPLLYCQRNYTADKNARAAWAFAQVYPELYDNNPDATYAYWVDTIYHINLADVPTVATYMTNQSDAVVYTQDTLDFLEDNFATGLSWWQGLSGGTSRWLQYAYYNGSSRASYYSGTADSEEPSNTIGIFAPYLWS